MPIRQVYRSLRWPHEVLLRFHPLAALMRSQHTSAMTAYADIDPVIDAWAQTTVKKLFTEWADQPVRFAYMPGLRPFECFQILIEPPFAGRVVVVARSVDTDDESEFEEQWEGATDALSILLEKATASVREWAHRCTASDN